MFNIFKSKPLLSKEDYEFQIETFKWLLRNFGGKHFYKGALLVLPTSDFFPIEARNGDDSVKKIFNLVKGFAGLKDWPCKLRAQKEDINPVIAPTLLMQGVSGGPGGTFKYKGKNDVVITYNPALANNINGLISTFAHELSHYLTGGAKEEPPGGWDNWEFATDIAATFLGFGVFMANNAFNFQQFTDVESQGWQMNRSGYLSEDEHLHALAIFLLLKEIPYMQASEHLKPYLKKTLKKAIKEIEKKDVIKALKQIDFKRA